MGNLKGKKEHKNREFKLSSLSIDNKTTVIFFTLIVLVMGYFSYKGMPKEAFPEVKFTTIYVGTPYSGNSPQDIESLITRPLEKEIKSVSGINDIRSNSIQDMSTIIVEFDTDVDIETALTDVKDAVDKAKKNLPTDLDQDPIIDEVNIGEFPIMFINISSGPQGSYTPQELKIYAEYLKDRIEDLDEISSVNIRGLEEKEVKIFLDLHKMSAMKISFRDIENSIKGRNISISAGNLKESGIEKSIKIDSEIDDVQELADIIIKHEKGKIIYLKEVLSKPITFQPEYPESFALFTGNKVLQLDIIKGSGKNLLEASDKINSIIHERDQKNYAGKLPGKEKLDLRITLDQSYQTRAQVASLENNIISGVILVVLVLLFFLGTRNSLFVGIAIPLSMFLSYMILSVLGITINMMVLFGLIMALGMLVDNGIVVVENIYRYMDEGYSPVKAAKEGVGEVAWPIISSTATTLAAFLPLAIWPGIIGEFMKFLPLTLIVVLSSSLFVGLIINPVFTSVFMKVQKEKIDKKKWGKFGLISMFIGFFLALGAPFLKIISETEVTKSLSLTLIFSSWTLIFLTRNRKKRVKIFKQWLLGVSIALLIILLPESIGKIIMIGGVLTLLNVYVLTPYSNKFQNNFLPKLEGKYERLLKKSLRGRNPIRIFIGTIILLIISAGLMGKFTPKVIFFPENEPKYINVFIEKPIGTEIKETKDITMQIRDAVIETLQEKRIDEFGDEYTFNDIIKAFSTNVGKGTSDPGDPASSGGNNSTPNKARINIEFEEYENRKGLSTSKILKSIQDKIKEKNFIGVAITVDKNRDGPPVGKAINVEVTGENFAELIDVAQLVKNTMTKAEVPGVEELKTDLETGKPEILVNINYAKAGRLGVSAADLATVIRTALFGKEVSKYKKGEEDFPIQLRLDDKYRYNIRSLLNQKVTFRSQSNGQIKQIPINAIATIKDTTTLGSVKRKNQKRVVTVYSNVEQGYNPTEVNDQLKAELASLQLPEGYNYKFTGEQEKQAEEGAFLIKALLIAVFLILLIIVSQFNKISAPAIILTSVFFSIIGVLLGLVAFQMDFVIIMTMIGIISLAGVVVNNAIVLLDYADLLKKRKIEEELDGDQTKFTKEHLIETIIQTGKTRLRPVLLTAITTVLGLVPLAVGLNIDFFGLFKNFDANFSIGGDTTLFWGPMSWTIIFGITFATFLTLIVVPVMYIGMERFKGYIYNRVKFQNEKINENIESTSNVFQKKKEEPINQPV